MPKNAYTRQGLRLLICGGQETPAHVLHQLLDRAHAKRPVAAVLESGQPGAQQAVGAWCRQHGNTPVIWERVGPGWDATLIAEGDVHAVLALPGDDQPGWANQAAAAGLPVWRPLAGPPAP